MVINEEMISSYPWLKICFSKRLTFSLTGVYRIEKLFGSGENNQLKKNLIVKIAWKTIVHILHRSLKHFCS